MSLLLLPIIVLLSYQASVAQESQIRWLVGRWEGKIERFYHRSGPARTLRVRSVARDGSVDAFWSVTGRDEFPCDVTVDGSQVTVFITVSQSSVRLRREGDDVLAGKFTLKDGEVFPIKLDRMTLPPS